VIFGGQPGRRVFRTCHGDGAFPGCNTLISDALPNPKRRQASVPGPTPRSGQAPEIPPGIGDFSQLAAALQNVR